MIKGAPKVITIDTRTIIRAVLVVVLVFVFWQIRSLMLVLLTSIVIASFTESAVKKLSKYHIHRTLSVVIIYVLALSAIVALFSVFVPVLLDEVSSLVTVLDRYIPDTSILNNLQGATVENTKTLVTGISQNASIPDLIGSAQTLVSGVSGGFFATASFVFGGLINLVLIIIISFYLSIQEHGVENFLKIITPDAQEEYIIDLWRRSERKIGLWFQGQLLVGLLVGVLIYLGLTILGVNYAIVLALLAAVFELVPFGIILAIIPGVGFAYAGGGAVMAAKALGLYLIVQQFEAYLIYPLVVKRAIGISPLVVILSILIGAALAGFWGVILAIPVAVCLLEYWGDIEKRKSAR